MDCKNRPMRDREDFLAWVDSRVRDAEIAVHDGDAGPRREIWSDEERVTVLGAWKSATGRAELEELFSMLEQSFSRCDSSRFEVVAAEVSGDMAYTVGYEHTRAVVNGEPPRFLAPPTDRAVRVRSCVPHLRGSRWVRSPRRYGGTP
jgi:hypothetical protein